MSTPPKELSYWRAEVGQHMPHLSKPVLEVLVLWSYGIAYAQSCGRTVVTAFLALVLQQKAAAIEQRLYEWCIEAKHKSGKQRREWDVRSCFSPLLAWIVKLWKSEQIALVLDATSLGDRFVVLTVSVAYRQMGLPVAWMILPAQEKHPWKTEWLILLRRLWRAIPRTWTVLVLTDRGLYADWLFKRIVRLGWHPFMRVNGSGRFSPAVGSPQSAGRYLKDLISKEHPTYAGQGTVFGQQKRLTCTILCWWDEHYTDPWFILTDLHPQHCQVAWYGLRAWCEQGFKCIKRGGWQWQRTQMTDPTRAERLWLAMALAMLWVVSIGSTLEDSDSEFASLFVGWRPNSSSLPGHARRFLRLARLGMVEVRP